MRKVLWLLLFVPILTGFTWSANMKGTWKGQGARTVGGQQSEGALEVTLVLTDAPTVARGDSANPIRPAVADRRAECGCRLVGGDKSARIGHSCGAGRRQSHQSGPGNYQ